jgi:hypothetical protein
MARTPLLCRFQKLFQDFSEAEPTGRTVGEIREERLQRGPTRREILKAGGAALAATAVLGPARALRRIRTQNCNCRWRNSRA